MAPATLAGATARVTKTRTGWDRDSVINAIQEWVATYGEPPRAADWNPSSAKWSGQLWRVERYRAGRVDGTPWPALNSAKRPFNGSLTEAIVAAGFEPAKPGPKRRRDVNPEQADRAVISPEGRAMLEAALARARDAERRVVALESRLERRRASRPAGAAVAKRAVVAAAGRAERAAAQATGRAEAAVAKATEDLATARMDAAEARTTAKKLASRLERSEATVSSLRDERRQLKADRDRSRDRVVALERLLEAARGAARGNEDFVLRSSQAQTSGRRHLPDAALVRDAQATARAARRDAEAAELRAARCERELRETVAAVKGEQRRLTPAELDELRKAGPTGPGVMATALKTLAAARADGDRTALRAALTEVARSAITWQERI